MEHDLAFVPFEQTAWIRTPGMDGAEAVAGPIKLPKERTETVALSKTFAECDPPGRGEGIGRGKFGKAAGDLAAAAAMGAIMGWAPRDLRPGLCGYL